MRSIGFTGTRKGMTAYQREALWRVLAGGERGVFHHGDCVGSDEEAHAIALEARWEVVVHPPVLDHARAFCGGRGVTVLPAKPYLERNRDIVDSCSLLVAAPETDEEKIRSGTWSTVRAARRIGREVFVLSTSAKERAKHL